MGKYPRTRANRERIAPARAIDPIEPIILAVPTVTEPCEHARQFAAFADLVLATLVNTNQSLHVNRAKVLITDQYFRIRRTLPIYHQDTTTYNGHPCIYQAYVAAYGRLERKELEVAPPAFEIPLRQAPRSRKKSIPPPDLNDPETIHKLILGE